MSYCVLSVKINLKYSTMKTIVVFSVVLVSCLAQRSPYAGRLPIGFPYVEPSVATPDPLGNRFGEDDGTTTTIRLPIEALGDAALVQRISKMPVDQQPFWYINWKALEANRNQPQTYSQRGNGFVDDSSNSNSIIFRR
ncbi:hypothetical protein PYW07_005078 [Mythimna separata]|uniref:Uncharacterized protein n=1 Tax=Mythimna separata TaxID=271217 RepID=A0AAD8DNP1_MYTSE|nr:hypothetical protein PYW07_005078 [Mythimna separata]